MDVRNEFEVDTVLEDLYILVHQFMHRSTSWSMKVTHHQSVGGKASGMSSSWNDTTGLIKYANTVS